MCSIEQTPSSREFRVRTTCLIRFWSSWFCTCVTNKLIGMISNKRATLVSLASDAYGKNAEGIPCESVVALLLYKQGQRTINV